MKPSEAMLDESAVTRFVGPGSYERGRAYARQGRVSHVQEIWKGHTLVVAALVSGSERQPYSVLVDLIAKVGGILTPVGSTCTCPLDGYCKHVAATLIAYRQQTAPRVAKRETVPAWRQALNPLLAPNSAPGDTHKLTYPPLALNFELREPYPDYRYYGYGRPQQPKTNESKHHLAARPAILSGNNRWKVSGVTWRKLQSMHATAEDLPVSPEHREWLRTMWAIYSTSRTGYDDAWLKLDDFSNPRLWALLHEGQRLGIRYITSPTTKHPRYLTVHEQPAEVNVDLHEKNAKSGLSLKPRVRFDNKSLEPARLGFIGEPAHGVYWWPVPDYYSLSRADIHLAPLEKDLHPFLRQAIQARTKLDIPAEDKQAFAKEYYPKLVQKLSFKNRDVKSIKFPDISLPEMLIDVAYEPPHRLAIRLGWRYRQGDKETVLPLEDTANTSATVTRNPDAEQALLKSCGGVVAADPAWWNENEPGRLHGTVRLQGSDTIRFIEEKVPRLQALPHIIVLLPTNLPDYKESREGISIEMGLDEDKGEDGDWFNLAVTCKLGGQEVPFNQLFQALAEGQPTLLLDNGTYCSLDRPELQKLRQLIEEARGLQDKTGEGLRISRFQAGLWDELQALGIVTRQAESWQQSVRGLLDVAYIPEVPVPKTLKAKLRPYQQQGYQWLHFLRQHNLGGILADDMGLGKTLQTIALLLAMKDEENSGEKKGKRGGREKGKGKDGGKTGPALIIAPTSVAANWMSELENFAPSLRAVYMNQRHTTAAKLAKEALKADVIISSYALFRLDFDSFYAKYPWSALILDEAQFVKNHQSKGYKNARQLETQFKIALSGTPLENNLMELWSLLSIVAPGLFPSPKHFGDFYQKPVEKEGNRELLDQLRRRVRPLMLRRTKEQVAGELPPKIEQIVEVELLPKHREAYDLYLQRERQRILGLLGDMDKNRFMIFKSLTTLRMLSLDPKLVDAKKYKNAPSSKLESLMEQLDEMLSEKHRALIFSQFTSFLSTVREALDKRGIPYLYLDGSTKNRGALLKEFKNGEAPLFLISLKAGGFGLNLTEADYCFLLDPWWNPAVEQQAVDRTHRIGQSKQVIVYRLIAKDTIEEKVMALKARKSKLFASMMDEGSAFSGAITADDIKELFTE
jgi:superfamily II DNA or RNA helicase